MISAVFVKIAVNNLLVESAIAVVTCGFVTADVVVLPVLVVTLSVTLEVGIVVGWVTDVVSSALVVWETGVMLCSS